MNRKIVITAKAYTDGDWGIDDFDKTFNLNHKSRYFDYDFYEYTYNKDYTYEIKRVTDVSHIDNVIRILEEIVKDIHGRYIIESVIERVNKAIEWLKRYKNNGPDYMFTDYFESVKLSKEDMDKHILSEFDVSEEELGNSSIEFSIVILDTDIKEIDHIVYKD